jgi:hypothetical protein
MGWSVPMRELKLGQGEEKSAIVWHHLVLSALQQRGSVFGKKTVTAVFLKTTVKSLSQNFPMLSILCWKVGMMLALQSGRFSWMSA